MPETRQTCFVVSPIGAEGSDTHKAFREVMEYLIKPAVASCGMDLQVMRADDIQRPGSFIKDILEQLLHSYLVVADLTHQNPNVFYELGVRHALSPRTILIAQSINDVPSDLREYRTIIYDTSARGATDFAKRFKKFVQEIATNPTRPDNPVLDRLGRVLKTRTKEGGKRGSVPSTSPGAPTKGAPSLFGEAPTSLSKEFRGRLDRLLKLNNAEEQAFGEVHFEERGKDRVVTLPARQGPFRLHFVMEDEQSIGGYFYLALADAGTDVERLLPDVRVLMERCSQGQKLTVAFIIATPQGLGRRRQRITSHFREMRKFLPKGSRGLFSLDLWDETRLSELEREVGLTVKLSRSKK